MKNTRLLATPILLAILFLAACKKNTPEQRSFYTLNYFTPAIANVGTDVTIKGVFGTNPTVKVNGVAVPVKSSNDSIIVITVPTGATSGKVTVACDGGINLTSVGDLKISEKVFNKIYGGSMDDRANAFDKTQDDGYIMAGFTFSNDGDISGNHGLTDAWVIKLDGNGNKVWQKVLGGTGSDQATSIKTTSDGGYIMVGTTTSNDGDVSYHAINSYNDVWVVKLDGNGNIVWQKILGGVNEDFANSIGVTPDGSYILAGSTSSTDGDVKGNHGSGDAWVVKLDAGGNILWQKALGGTHYDQANSITSTPDGGYIMGGWTTSNDGDISGYHGGSNDAWVVKLDGSGNLVWQKTLGGTDYDYAASITPTSDGGYIMTGSTMSNDGDVSGNHGNYDAWIVKLDGYGNKIWQKALGGSDRDLTSSMTITSDGGYLIAGSTGSNDGDVNGNHGDYDAWIFKLDASGNLLWQKTFGGTVAESAYSIIPTSDSEYVMAAHANSNDGDLISNHGNGDAWIVKFKF